MGGESGPMAGTAVPGDGNEGAENANHAEGSHWLFGYIHSSGKTGCRGSVRYFADLWLDHAIEWHRLPWWIPFSPTRITYHTVVRGPEDLDEELLFYLKEAWHMANLEKRR